MQPKQVKLLASYNRWMNERLYAVCSDIPDTERKQDRGAFFRSIHGTLNHLLLADRIWLGRFENEPFQVDGLDSELYADFSELRSERALTDQRIEHWAAGITEEDLSGKLHYTGVTNPAPQALEMWIAVTHFFNHQTHHRGQLTALLSQCGREYGVTDLILLPDML